MGHKNDLSSGLPIPLGWYAVAYSKDLQPKEVQPVYFFGQELVLFRTESGKAQLMEPYCPHLGAHLGHGGQVKGEALACPFHAWEIDTAGGVVNIPYAKTTPKRATEGPCLHTFPMQERNQMVWAWYHPNQEEPSFDIEDVPQLSDPNWSELDTYEWEINTCLQESGENAVDIAHFVYVHETHEMPQASISLDGPYRTTDMISHSPAIDEEGNIDMETSEEMHLVTRNLGPGLAVQEFARAFKTVMMATMMPITADRIKLRFAFTKPKDITDQFNMFTDVLIEEIVRQVGCDIPIWENKIYRDNPILCDGDGPIAKYRKWFKQFYVEEGDGEETSTPLRAVK